MWEYRIYYERDFISQLPQLIDFSNSIPESRSDYYYDLSKEQYGLKERMNKDKSIVPKIELKIRYDKTSPLGVEYWSKVISHEYHKDMNTHLSLYEIKQILEEYAETDPDFGSDIDLFLKNIPSDYKITTVSKTRWESELWCDDDLIEIEYVVLEVDGERIYGFSLEGENLELIEELIMDWGLDEYQFDGGYPSLIKALNTTKISPLQYQY